MKEMPTIQLGNFTMRWEVQEPNPKLMEIARRELRETPDLVRKSISSLQHLIRGDGRLTAPVENVAWLKKFLRATQFYPDEAFKLVQSYYTFKVKHKSIFDEMVPSRTSRCFSHDVITLLPKRDQDGHRVLVVQAGNRWDQKKTPPIDAFKGVVMFLEAAMMEPETQICGCQIIVDAEDTNIIKVLQLIPTYASLCVDWIQSTHARIVGIHAVNQPFGYSKALTIIKPLLRDDIYNKIIFHGRNRGSLHKHVSPDCLPACYGGSCTLPQISCQQWYTFFKGLEAEFEAINSYGYNKRTKK